MLRFEGEVAMKLALRKELGEVKNGMVLRICLSHRLERVLWRVCSFLLGRSNKFGLTPHVQDLEVTITGRTFNGNWLEACCSEEPEERGFVCVQWIII